MTWPAPHRPAEPGKPAPPVDPVASRATLRFELLGPLRVMSDDRPVPVGGIRSQALLATLLVDTGRTVPLQQLIDAVWDDDPPDTARRQVQNYVSRLRRDLAVGSHRQVILAERPGYRVPAGVGVVDVDVFAGLVTAAGRNAAAGLCEEATGDLRKALSLWRGAALGGMGGRVLSAATRRLEEQRIAAAEQLYTLELDLGRHHEVTAELTDLVAAHPLCEPFVGHLMRALHRSGRTAEALQTYQQLRARLADDLGVDPNADLQRLHAHILSDNPGGTGPRAAEPAPGGAPPPVASRPVVPVPPAPAADGAPVPNQLPATLAGFAGRVAAMRQLDGMLEPAQGLAVGVVSGPAGVGKTALAVHWAHRCRERFPDGTLYVDLGGYGPDRPMPLAAALTHLLDGLGVPADRIPPGEQAAAALYRSTLTGRRVLVVLDNAREPAQVVPLLPGSANCAVLVTSRNSFAGLAVTAGARLLPLGPVTADEAREMLTARLGGERIGSEPGAVDDMVRQCAHLPLALAIAAARAAVRPGFSLRTVVGDTAHRLDALDGGHPSADLRTTLSWSYRALSPPAARLFRLLGLHPGPDITVPAAASLGGTTASRTRRALDELTRENLITEHLPGRYRHDDLLRAYCAELAERSESATDRESALRRVLDHYLASVAAAGQFVPGRRRRTPPGLPPIAPGVRPVEFGAEAEAIIWLAAQKQTLLAAVELAHRAGLYGHSWHLVRRLAPYLELCAHWREWMSVQKIALDAAQRLGDRAAEGCAHLGLANAYLRLGRYRDAMSHHDDATRCYSEVGDWSAQAWVGLNSGTFLVARGRYWEGLARAERAMATFERLDDSTGLRRALSTIAEAWTRIGNPALGTAYRDRAAEIRRTCTSAEQPMKVSVSDR